MLPEASGFSSMLSNISSTEQLKASSIALLLSAQEWVGAASCSSDRTSQKSWTRHRAVVPMRCSCQQSTVAP